MRVKKEEVSTKELLCLLHEYANDLDMYEFGLPIYTNESLRKMQNIVNKWLAKRRKYEQQQLAKNPY